MGLVNFGLKLIAKGKNALKFGSKFAAKGAKTTGASAARTAAKSAKTTAAAGTKTVNKAAAAAKSQAAKPNVPIGQSGASAAAKIRSGMKPDHVREFIGKDPYVEGGYVLSEEEALGISQRMQARLPENCRIDLVVKDGSSLTLSKEMFPQSNMFIPVAEVPCNVTGAGNRLRFLDKLTSAIENNPAQYGF